MVGRPAVLTERRIAPRSARPGAGREGLVRAANTVAIMVGPSLAAGGTLLIDPDHTGTALPLLATAIVVNIAAFAVIFQASVRRPGR